MKIIHDKSKCIGCGVCAALCPEYFEMKAGKAHLRKSKISPGTEIEELTTKNIEDCVKEAINSCPMQSIQVVNE